MVALCLIPLAAPLAACAAHLSSALLTLLAASDCQAGGFPAHWIGGGPDCPREGDLQVHAFNEDFYILRESGCINAEKPFLYLMFGNDRALLEDTGVARREAGATGEKVIPTAPVVMDLIAQWAARKHRAPVPLVVIHSHAHGDHVAGDPQFQALPNVQVIAPTPSAIQQAAGINAWPTGTCMMRPVRLTRSPSLIF